ncbi:MAG: glycosyltransferase family 4 protein [Candidatus Paceibacterota bacterium]
MKTRILMFGWEFPPFNSGGLGVACQGLTRSLSRRGFEVLFVMPKKLDVRSEFARMIFADVDASKDAAVLEGYVVNSMLTPYLSSSTYMRKEGERGIYGRDLFSEVARYRATGARIAREETFDIIYAHDWLSFGAGIEAKKATGKPLIVHVHATEFDRCGGESGINQEVFDVERQGMQEADCVIAVSELTKQIIIRYYGIASEKVRVVYNGIDESTAPSGVGMRRLRSLKESGYKIVLFLGRITLQKGPDYFLRAAKRVLEKDPRVIFVVSGSGDMEDSILQLSASLGISKNVVFTGFLTGTDRHEMYVAADLFVMPSVSEPFGITPLESMKLGTPVLISKQSGVAEVVKHALKADFWDVDEMANKILSVVSHPALGESLSRNAQTEADALTWAAAAIKVDGIVHELIK